MALQTSGAISLNEIHVEAGGSSGSQATINDTDIRGLIDKSSGAQMAFNEWYGASAETVLTSAGNVNGQAQRQEITVSTFISSGETLRIPSNIWVWSDSTSTAALTVDIPCTIINEGKIIGRGGNGGSKGATAGAGGYAIRVTSSGVTIQNSSGAYIAGGGGGGGSRESNPIYKQGQGGGGGGAGGGAGGAGDSRGSDTQYDAAGGAGGALNASGSNGSQPGLTGTDYGGGGGGGGRVLPATTTTGFSGSGSSSRGGNGGTGGGVGGEGATADGGSGSGANNVGGNAVLSGYPDVGGGGGGGGWGARGGYVGSGPSHSGGYGGAAISKTTSYTLTNNGTIYGST